MDHWQKLDAITGRESREDVFFKSVNCNVTDGTCSDEPYGPGPAGEATVSCMCGGAASSPYARDPLDGLSPAQAPLQSRLHSIILDQKVI